jgi:hypothetical protein
MMVLENRNASVADAGKKEMWVTFVRIIVQNVIVNSNLRGC